MSTVYNFSAGPAMLPYEVLAELREALPQQAGGAPSIMEVSHRGKEYGAVHEEALNNLRQLLELPEEYAVLLMQGGATGQFALLAMNLLGEGQTADYINTGTWAAKAIQEAKCVGTVNIAADTAKSTPARMPKPEELKLTPGAAYVHLTSNETIAGVQWKTFPKTDSPLVADMSSDILSKPMDIKAFGLIYAGAQKNLGPSGVTVVVIRRDLAQRASERVPKIFRYSTHMEQNSLSNTPPCLNIYLLMLVSRWLIRQGGVKGITQRNEAKAECLYQALTGSTFYRATADAAYRSTMNVTFRLPSEELEAAFVKEATAQGLVGLKGHRSVGGIRASIYNAFPSEGVDALVSFMQDFERTHG